MNYTCMNIQVVTIFNCIIYVFVLTKGDVMRSARGLFVFVTSQACSNVGQHCTLNKS